MNSDFRVRCGYQRNIKIKRLRRRHGAEGVLYHLALLDYTASHRPAGIYDSAEDLELAIDWPATPGEFAEALIDLRLLDRLEDDRIYVHDWHEHNEYAVHDPARSLKGRRNAHMKHCEGKGKCDKDYCPNYTGAPTEQVAEQLAATCSAPSTDPSTDEKHPPNPPQAGGTRRERRSRRARTADEVAGLSASGIVSPDAERAAAEVAETETARLHEDRRRKWAAVKAAGLQWLADHGLDTPPRGAWAKDHMDFMTAVGVTPDAWESLRSDFDAPAAVEATA